MGDEPDDEEVAQDPLLREMFNARRRADDAQAKERAARETQETSAKTLTELFWATGPAIPAAIRKIHAIVPLGRLPARTWAQRVVRDLVSRSLEERDDEALRKFGKAANLADGGDPATMSLPELRERLRNRPCPPRRANGKEYSREEFDLSLALDRWLPTEIAHRAGLEWSRGEFVVPSPRPATATPRSMPEQSVTPSDAGNEPPATERNSGTTAPKALDPATVTAIESQLLNLLKLHVELEGHLSEFASEIHESRRAGFAEGSRVDMHAAFMVAENMREMAERMAAIDARYFDALHPWVMPGQLGSRRVNSASAWLHERSQRLLASRNPHVVALRAADDGFDGVRLAEDGEARKARKKCGCDCPMPLDYLGVINGVMRLKVHADSYRLESDLDVLIRREAAHLRHLLQGAARDVLSWTRASVANPVSSRTGGECDVALGAPKPSTSQPATDAPQEMPSTAGNSGRRRSRPDQDGLSLEADLDVQAMALCARGLPLSKIAARLGVDRRSFYRPRAKGGGIDDDRWPYLAAAIKNARAAKTERQGRSPKHAGDARTGLELAAAIPDQCEECNSIREPDEEKCSCGRPWPPRVGFNEQVASAEGTSTTFRTTPTKSTKKYPKK